MVSCRGSKFTVLLDTTIMSYEQLRPQDFGNQLLKCSYLGILVLLTFSWSGLLKAFAKYFSAVVQDVFGPFDTDSITIMACPSSFEMQFTQYYTIIDAKGFPPGLVSIVEPYASS